MTGNSKKITAAFLIALVIFSSVSFAIPKTSALFGIDEALRQIFVAIKDSLVKTLVNNVTNQTVRWIQGGGEPKFVSDFGGFLGDVADESIGEFINNEENFRFLCSPFKAQLQVVLPYIAQPSVEQGLAACTLTGVVGNIEDFFGDFEEGGWIAFTQASQPNNNFIGALLTLNSQAIAQAGKKQESAKQEVQAGGGFLSVKRCIVMGDGECLKEETVTPGRVVDETLSQALGVQLDFATNMDSLISAIVNMLIDQIAGGARGLLFAGRSTSGDDTAELSRKIPEPSADLHGRFIREWGTILTSKKQSVDSADKIVSTLNALKENACSPAVTPAQIGFAEDEVKRLKNDTESVQKKYDLANRITNNLSAVDNRGNEDKFRRFFASIEYLFFTGGTAMYNTSAATIPVLGREFRQRGLLDELIHNFAGAGITVQFRDLIITTQFGGFDTEEFRKQFASGIERKKARDEAIQKSREYTELLTRQIECVGADAYRNLLVQKVKPAHDGWGTIINSKQEGSSYIAGSIGYLTQLQNSGCSLSGQRDATAEQKQEVVSAIAAARSTRSAISTDISILQPKLNEAVKVLGAILKAEDASSLIDVTEDALVFEDKYVKNPLESGSWSQEAQDAAASQTLDLQRSRDAHNRAWEICRPSPAAPGA